MIYLCKTAITKNTSHSLLDNLYSFAVTYFIGKLLKPDWRFKISIYAFQKFRWMNAIPPPEKLLILTQRIESRYKCRYNVVRYLQITSDYFLRTSWVSNVVRTSKKELYIIFCFRTTIKCFLYVVMRSGNSDHNGVDHDDNNVNADGRCVPRLYKKTESCSIQNFCMQFMYVFLPNKITIQQKITMMIFKIGKWCGGMLTFFTST